LICGFISQSLLLLFWSWSTKIIKDQAFLFVKNFPQQKLASQKSVTDAINAVSRIFQRLSEFYLKSGLLFDVITPAADAVSLLYVMRDGLKADGERRARLKKGKLSAEDLTKQEPV
jgi:hypothetical protein